MIKKIGTEDLNLGGLVIHRREYYCIFTVLFFFTRAREPFTVSTSIYYLIYLVISFGFYLAPVILILIGFVV